MSELKRSRSILPQKILDNKWFVIIFNLMVFLAAAGIVIMNQEIIGTVIFICIICLCLVLSDDFMDSVLPLLLLSVFVTRCYNSFDRFIAYWWMILPAAGALLFHFIYYKRRCGIGTTFLGICGVAAAVTLGGVGSITVRDYFKPMALYYTIGLGIGMVALYLLVKPHLEEPDSKRKMARNMYMVGLFACFCVLRFYIEDWNTFMETKRYLSFQSGNNLATFLMLALPFPFWFASRHRIHLAAVPVMYACIVLCGSRGGLLMGTAELIILFVVYAFVSRGNIINRVIYIVCAAGSVIALFLGLPVIMRLYGIDTEAFAGMPLKEYITMLPGLFVQENEARVGLLKRACSDFAGNPLFGVGVAYQGNDDLYRPVKGAMNWYHMWFAQIIGSMGIAGVIAYGTQLVLRLKVLLKNMSMINITLAMSYLGLLMMSQMNPGEFCPIPYAMLPVLYFCMIESTGRSEPAPQARSGNTKTVRREIIG